MHMIWESTGSIPGLFFGVLFLKKKNADFAVKERTHLGQTETPYPSTSPKTDPCVPP